MIVKYSVVCLFLIVWISLLILLVRLVLEIFYSTKVKLELERQLSWYDGADDINKGKLASIILKLIDGYDQGKLTEEVKCRISCVQREMTLAVARSAISYSTKVKLELERQQSLYDEADTTDKAEIALYILELIDDYDQGKLTKEMKEIVAKARQEMTLASTVSATETKKYDVSKAS